MYGRDKVSEILERATKTLSREGLEGEVVCNVSEEQTVRSAWGQIHQSPLARSLDITIYARNGKKSASVSFGDYNTKAIRSNVKRVKDLVAVSPENPYLNDLALQPKVLPELFLPPIDEETLGHAWEKKAIALRDAQFAAGSIRCVASGRFFTGLAEIGVANTNGLLRYSAFTGSVFSLVVTGEHHLSALATESHTRVGGISPEAVIAEVIEKASQARNLPFYDPFASGKGPAKQFDILLHPHALASWAQGLSYYGFNGLMVHEKQSFLSGKLGQMITGKNISLRDDWKYPGFPAMPFDFEGVTRMQIPFIENGRVRGAVYDGSTAKKANLTPTGHSLKGSWGSIPLHIVFEGGNTTEEELIASCEKPTIYVTYFNYPGMPDKREAVFTATTRHGTFLVENGRFTHVLPPLRFKEQTAEAFKRVEGLSPTTLVIEEENYGDFYPQSIAVPFAKITNCTFVGSNKYK